MNRLYILLIFFLACLSGANAQFKPRSFGNFHITSASGDVFVLGRVDYLTQNTNSFISKGNTNNLYGGMSLNLNSHIWMPSFLQFNLVGNYNPGLNKSNFLFVSDFSETFNTYGLNLSSVLFSSKEITLSGSVSFNESIAYRDNLNKVTTEGKGQSIGLSLSKYIPISINYHNRKSNSVATLSNRRSEENEKELNTSIHKSFFKWDESALAHVYKQNERRYSDYLYSINFHETRFNNRIILGDDKEYILVSRVNNRINRGTIESERFSVNENLIVKLPYRLKLLSNYNYGVNNYLTLPIYNQYFHTNLSHQLYESLTSDVYFDSNTGHSKGFNSSISKYGFKINYIKRIILKGNLNLSYSLSQNHLSIDNDDAISITMNEEHVLADASISYLDGYDIDISTVIIRDSTGSIIYEENYDYILIEQGTQIEIQRIPGGEITNGATILADYRSKVLEDYAVNYQNHTYYSGIALFNGLIRLYYRGYFNRTSQSDIPDSYNFVSSSRKELGGRVQYKKISAAFNYTNTDSYIPYERYNYNLSYSFNFHSRFVLNVTAGYTDLTYTERDLNVRMSNIGGGLYYRLFSHTSLNVKSNYYDMVGDNNMGYMSIGTEIKTTIRSMSFILKYQYLQRQFNIDNINQNGVYLKIIRTF